MDLDPIILGHNQFIGVSHLSQEAARTRVERFSDMGRVGELLRFCIDSGVRGMMLSSHPRARDILDHLRAEGLAGGMSLYPLIPYAQGYVRRMNAVGLTGMLKEIVLSAPWRTRASIAAQGGLGLARKDLTRLLGAFVDVEMLAFKGFEVKAVFLHDAFVDLALALQAREQLEFFAGHVRERYGVRPGFVTMNFPLLVDSFKRWGFDRPLVMTTFNSVGFQMNPSRELCERALAEGYAEVVAMSTLAAGYLKPDEAFDYVYSLPGAVSTVVGVSTVQHAEETFSLIRKYSSVALSNSVRGFDTYG